MPSRRPVAADRAARELDVVANNIANVNTTGFKADGAVFDEFLSQPRAPTNLPAPTAA